MSYLCKTSKVNAAKLQSASEPKIYQNQINVRRTLQQLHPRSIDEKSHLIYLFISLSMASRLYHFTCSLISEFSSSRDRSVSIQLQTNSLSSHRYDWSNKKPRLDQDIWLQINLNIFYYLTKFHCLVGQPKAPLLFEIKHDKSISLEQSENNKIMLFLLSGIADFLWASSFVLASFLFELSINTRCVLIDVFIICSPKK